MPSRRATRAATRAAVAEEEAKADPDYDPAFAALPLSIRTKIDTAFARVSNPLLHEKPPPRKKRRTERENAVAGPSKETWNANNAPGGFMVDDVPGGFVVDDAPGGFVVDDGSGGFLVDDTAGGFIPEDNAGGFSLDDEVDIANYSLGGSTTGLGASGTHSPSSESDNADNNSAGHAKFITVDRIPGALVSLGLPPDDPDILRVFENASSGWASDDPSRRRQQDVGDVAHEKRVSKRDWRAVCTVLLVDAPAEDHTTSGPSHVREDIDERSDIYLTSDDDELDDDSSAFDEDEDDDNYGRSSRKSSRKVRTDRDDEDNEEPPLDEYQLAETRRAFGLFLDAVQDSSSSARPLQDRRIGIREVEGAAKLLKEKLTAEDILEMLEMFSTSPDKTLGMADFERMMRATHLV